MVYLLRSPWTRCSYKSFASRRSCRACSAICSFAKFEVIMNTASLHSTVLPLPSVSRPCQHITPAFYGSFSSAVNSAWAKSLKEKRFRITWASFLQTKCPSTHPTNNVNLKQWRKLKAPIQNRENHLLASCICYTPLTLLRRDATLFMSALTHQ